MMADYCSGWRSAVDLHCRLADASLGITRSLVALLNDDSGRCSAGVIETCSLRLEPMEASLELLVVQQYVPGSVQITVREGVVLVIFEA
jgi:hypothetical protein